MDIRVLDLDAWAGAIQDAKGLHRVSTETGVLLFMWEDDDGPALGVQLDAHGLLVRPGVSSRRRRRRAAA